MIALLPPLAAVCLAVLGCADPGATSLFEGPAATPFVVTSQVPAPGATAVSVDSPIDLTFSDLPDPDSVSRLNFVLFSGYLQFTGGFRVDLIDRRLRFVPSRSLPPHLGMHVRLTRGLKTLDGRDLAQDYDWTFATGDRGGGAPPPPAEVRLPDLAPLLGARCAECHQGPGAFHGLRLDETEAAARGLVGRPSEERPALPRVAAGDHARSYLMRKLLAAPGIVGNRMPPPPAAPLDLADLRRIADWIDRGAQN